MRNCVQCLLIGWGCIALSAAGIGASDAGEGGTEVAAMASARLGSDGLPSGVPIQLDLPTSLHMTNTGGSDGSGLCVFTSIEHSAMWQNAAELWGFQKWMTRRPGGGYPQKVDRMIDILCAERGVRKPRYIQVEDNDLEILKVACRTGRMPSVTYGYSPTKRYGGAKIAHMVTLLHADDEWFCCLDNNFPRTYEWMTPKEFLGVYRSGAKVGWSVIMLNPGPPPNPYRKEHRYENHQLPGGGTVRRPLDRGVDRLSHSGPTPATPPSLAL